MGEDYPTRTEIRRARKAQLQAWATAYDLDETGTVAQLRDRLLAHGEAEKIALAEEAEEGAPEEAEEEVEFLEEKAYVTNPKAVLSDETRELLAKRARLQSRRLAFRRQEWFRYKRLGQAWRRPRGHHSKLRRHLGYRGSLPGAGHRGPLGVRGLHPSGFEEVLVHRSEELEGLDPQRQAARIAHSVGTRKRLVIQERADELGIRILNPVVG